MLIHWNTTFLYTHTILHTYAYNDIKCFSFTNTFIVIYTCNRFVKRFICSLLLNSCHFFAFGIGFPDCFGIKLRYRREFWFYRRIWLRISDRLYILGLWAFSWGGNVEQEKLSNLLIPLCFERYFHAKSILITIYKYIYNKFRKSRINKCSRQTFILHKWHTM